MLLAASSALRAICARDLAANLLHELGRAFMQTVRSCGVVTILLK